MTCHSNNGGQELTFENIKQGGDQECPQLGKNIETSDYEVVARGDVEEPNNVPDTVFVEVVVTVDIALFQRIGLYYENGFKRKKNKPRTKSMQFEAELYVRKFISAVDIKFQPNEPIIRFHIKKKLIDDLPFIVDPNGLDPLETRKKMREYVDKKYADDMTYDVILALSANEKFKDLHPSVDGRFGVSAVGEA